MKNVPDVKWPTSPAHVGAFGPLAGRHDVQAAMSDEAVLTPAADVPPEPVEEVVTDVVPDGQDDEGPV